METTEKNLDYYRKNAEENYLTTPISVLRYISELEAALRQPPVSGSLELLSQMLNERKELAKQGFETWQELQMNSDSENALLRVIRLIGERQANDR